MSLPQLARAAFALMFFTALPSDALARPLCGNGVREAREECDGTDFRNQTCGSYGFDSGTLECSASCRISTASCTNNPVPTCGDGKVNQSSEECDGADLTGFECTDFGYDSGTLACDGTCGLDFADCQALPDPVCGDGAVNQLSEECDSDDLLGLACTDLGYDAGTLACDATCGYDESACTTNPPDAICGNDFVDGAFEECDGLSDAACPGACSDHCACPATSPSGELEVHVVDVGQGDGIVVVLGGH